MTIPRSKVAQRTATFSTGSFITFLVCHQKQARCHLRTMHVTRCATSNKLLAATNRLQWNKVQCNEMVQECKTVTTFSKYSDNQCLIKKKRKKKRTFQIEPLLSSSPLRPEQVTEPKDQLPVGPNLFLELWPRCRSTNYV